MGATRHGHVSYRAAVVANSTALHPCVGLLLSADANQTGDGKSWHPSWGWKWMPHHLSKDALWQKIRQEARADAVSLRARIFFCSFMKTFPSWSEILQTLQPEMEVAGVSWCPDVTDS